MDDQWSGASHCTSLSFTFLIWIELTLEWFLPLYGMSFLASFLNFSTFFFFLVCKVSLLCPFIPVMHPSLYYWFVRFLIYFFPVLLSYNGQVALCKYMVYYVLIWYTYIFQNNDHHSISHTHIPSRNYHFFFVVRTFKFYFVSNFQVCNIVLLTI